MKRFDGELTDDTKAAIAVGHEYPLSGGPISWFEDSFSRCCLGSIYIGQHRLELDPQRGDSEIAIGVYPLFNDHLHGYQLNKCALIFQPLTLDALKL